MVDEPSIASVSRQVTGLEKRVTDLERARQADRLDRKQSQDRIEASLKVMGGKVDGLMEIVVQFRGVARFLKVCAGIGTFAASVAAIFIAIHALWP